MPRDRSPARTPFLIRLMRWSLLLAALLLLWLGGAVAYVERIEQMPPPSEERTDAIVVLTGGAARMSTALRLLNDGKADRLLVSGVSQSATKTSLQDAVQKAMPDAAQSNAGGQGIDLQLLFECCVDLGFEAGDTAGNATETASWATARGYKSVRLVTANYHMPRALVEFGWRMPGIAILPHPVRSDTMRVEDWWQRRTATVFLLGEYSKYVAALLRAKLGYQLSETIEQTASEQKTSKPVTVPVEQAAEPAQDPQPEAKPDAEATPEKTPETRTPENRP